MPIDGEAPDPLDEFATPGELLGLIHSRKGLDGVREALVAWAGESIRERFELAAAELRAAGLTKVAKLVPPMVDLAHCPYSVPPYTDNPRANENNIRSWLWCQERRAKRMREKIRQVLLRAGIDPDQD
jgi:hypothetical protein